MGQVVVISILVMFSAFAAFAFAFATVGTLQVTRNASDGVLKYFFYAVFASNAVMVFYTGRNFDESGEMLQAAGGGGFLSTWAIRLTSIFMLVGSADQIVRYFRSNPKVEGVRALLMLSFAAYWVTNTIVPAFMSAHPVSVSLKWFYPVILAYGFMCMSDRSAQGAIEACRNAIVLFCAASLLMIVVAPGVVLDRGYSQGYIPGVPRLAGLAPHAILMGMNASIGMWCLMAYPIKSRGLRQLAWGVCLLSMFLAQSKTVWLTFLLAVPVLRHYQNDTPWFKGKKLGDIKLVYGAAWFAAAAGAVLITLYMILGGGIDKAADFSQSKQGEQLMSLTGRDRIWAVALQEWRQAPVFGYGLPIFGPEFRDQVKMPWATSAHNQFIDSLSRAGIVGCTGIATYILLLLWLGFKYGRVTRGLSTVLALSIIIRTTTGMPLTATLIGFADTPHYLLLVVLAAGFLHQKRIVAAGRMAGA